jgi:hypothetical protein
MESIAHFWSRAVEEISNECGAGHVENPNLVSGSVARIPVRKFLKGHYRLAFQISHSAQIQIPAMAATGSNNNHHHDM